MKRCTRCSLVKATIAFSVQKRNKNGLQSHCKACNKVDRDEHAEEKAAYQARYYLDNKSYLLQDQKERDALRKDAISANKRAYYLNNKIELAVYKQIYRKENSDKINALVAQRAAAKMQQTPPWLTKTQLKEIEEFYSLAKELRWLSEEPLHVDHIVPLKGKNVSGLHVPWNLQILPASVNISKSNKCA